MPAPRKRNVPSLAKKKRAAEKQDELPSPRQPIPWPGIFAIIALTLAAYIPAFSAGYIWDDSDHVTQVPFQRTATVLKWVWLKLGTTPQYYPLTHTTFWLEYRLWGMNPAGYHTVNVLLHIACALLAWRVLSKLQLRGACLVAAIFAVHPVHVESVAWITERKNTLSALFYLLAMLSGLRAFSVSASAGNRWIAYGLCLLFFVLAVLSKTVTCTLPAVFVLILWWKHGRLARRDILLLLPMFAIALGFAKLTSGMEQWNVGAIGPEFSFTPAERILIAGRAIWFYAGKLLWPHPLIFMYPRWNIDPHAAWQWAFPTAVVIVVAALWILRGRFGRGPLVAVLFFIGTLFPALGFVNVYPMRFSFVADHFQYLASLGLLTLIVQMLIQLARFVPAKAGTFRAIFPAALLLALAALTFGQARIYRDDATLWRDTLAKNPRCWLAMDNLGADAAARGDRPAAFAWYARALHTHPNQQEAHVSLGSLFESAQPPRFEDAEREFRAAVAIRPNDARPIHELARLHVAEGNYPAALSEYEIVLAMEPKLELARMEYANVLRTLNRPKDAEAQYRKAMEINPDSVDARSGLAGMYYLAGDTGDALSLMAEAIDINPTDPALHNNTGVFLMAAGHSKEAAEEFKNAIAANPTFADAYDGLGNALAAQGQTLDAGRMFRKALELNPDFNSARQHLDSLSHR